MRALALLAGLLLLVAGATPTYPIACMALWLPGAALVIWACSHPHRR